MHLMPLRTHLVQLLSPDRNSHRILCRLHSAPRRRSQPSRRGELHSRKCGSSVMWGNDVLTYKLELSISWEPQDVTLSIDATREASQALHLLRTVSLECEDSCLQCRERGGGITKGSVMLRAWWIGGKIRWGKRETGRGRPSAGAFPGECRY